MHNCWNFSLDVDECNSTSTNNCSSDARCVNVDGLYNCSCNSGYEGDGFNCSGKYCVGDFDK